MSNSYKGMHNKDTGSTLVQLQRLNDEIKKLTPHMKNNKKDKHSLRGLSKKVGKRNRLLFYLKNNTKHMKYLQDNSDEYQPIITLLSNKF